MSCIPGVSPQLRNTQFSPTGFTGATQHCLSSGFESWAQSFQVTKSQCWKLINSTTSDLNIVIGFLSGLTLRVVLMTGLSPQEQGHCAEASKNQLGCQLVMGYLLLSLWMLQNEPLNQQIIVFMLQLSKHCFTNLAWWMILKDAFIPAPLLTSSWDAHVLLLTFSTLWSLPTLELTSSCSCLFQSLLLTGTNYCFQSVSIRFLQTESASDIMEQYHKWCMSD